MFDPKIYHNACDRMALDAEKIEEMIFMTENQKEKRPVRRPARMALIAAALAAALGITASAAEIPAVKEFFATIFVTVSADGEAAGLNIPDVAMEERAGRSILVIDGEETDVTDALAQKGEYLYEGDGFQVRVDKNGVAVITSYGENGTTVTWSTEAGSEIKGSAAYTVTTDGQVSYNDYAVSVDVTGADTPVDADEMTTYEIIAGENGSMQISPID